jgi:hypothetical protein
MELSPERRDRLARLIASELADLRDAATAAGTPPGTIAEIIEERRRVLEAASSAFAESDAGAGAASPADPDPDVAGASDSNPR